MELTNVTNIEVKIKEDGTTKPHMVDNVVVDTKQKDTQYKTVVDDAGDC